MVIKLCVCVCLFVLVLQRLVEKEWRMIVCFLSAL